MKLTTGQWVSLVLGVSVLLMLVLVALGHAAACGKSGTTYTCTDTGTPTGNVTQFNDTFADASCGDTIILPAAGAASGGVEHRNTTASGSAVINITNKSCSCNGAPSQAITIRGSGTLPAPGVRATYSDVPQTAIIRAMSSSPAVWYANGAGCVTWEGVTFTSRDGTTAPAMFMPTIVYQNSDDTSTVHDVTYDRVIIRPYEEETATPDSITTRTAAIGVRLDGIRMTVKNSTLDGFCCKQSNDGVTNTQSEAIGIVSGEGPFTITNNYLGAYGWNIFTGGGGGGSPRNTATLSASTTTSATLSNVTNLAVGDTIRFEYAAGINDPTCCRTGGNGTPSGTPTNCGTILTYAAATINTISGNDITFTLASSPTPAPSTGPDVPGQAAWNGEKLNGFTVTYNTLNKRDAWKSNSGQCKSFWEIKEGSEIVFEGNRLMGPVDTTGGTLCPMNTAFATNQNGGNPWAASRNNTFRSNLMCGLGSLFHNVYTSYCYARQDASDNVLFTNNLLVNGPNRFSIVQNMKGGDAPVFTHNTFGATGRFSNGDGSGVDTNNMVFRDNVVNGVSLYFANISDLVGLSTSYNKFRDTSGSCTGAPTSGNCNGWTGGTGDFGYATVAGLQFDDATDAAAVDGFCNGGDYHSYKRTAAGNDGSDGTPAGVNFTTLDAALAGQSVAASPTGASGTSIQMGAPGGF